MPAITISGPITQIPKRAPARREAEMRIQTGKAVNAGCKDILLITRGARKRDGM